MIKEKHTLTNPYNHHALSRYIDVYEVTTDGCSSSPMSGYKGTEATLIDQPAWNEKFSSWSLTGATATGNNYVINNDVTAKANYETAKNVTTIDCTSTKNSGFIGDTASLTYSSPAWNEKFSAYSMTGATLTGDNFRFTGSDITAQAIIETAKNLTLEQEGEGIVRASVMSGFIGDRVNLTNMPSAGYNFSGYALTGATLTGYGHTFYFEGNDVTAKAIFSRDPSAVYYTHTANIICNDRSNAQLNINTPVTGYNYVAVKFDANVITRYTLYAWNCNVNFNTGSWNMRKHSYANHNRVFYPVRNGQSFTPVYGGVYSDVIDGKTCYSTYDGSTKYTFILDRSANDCSAFMRSINGSTASVYLGHGPVAQGVTSVNNVYFLSEANSYSTANNFYVIGFDKLSGAVNNL